MKVIEITSSCGRTLPHPTIDYASLRVDVSARATLADGDDPSRSMAKLHLFVKQECWRQMRSIEGPEET